MTEQTVNRQYDAAIRIEKIKQALGARMLDGEEYDLQELIDAEAQLAVAYSAEGEEQRRNEAEALALVQRRREEVRSEIGDLIKEREQVLQTAHAACATLCEALETLFADNAKISAKMRSLGLSPPQGIGDHDGKHRISYRIAHALVKAVGSGHFGAIEMKTLGGHMLPDGSKPDESWITVDSRQNNFRAAMKGVR